MLDQMSTHISQYHTSQVSYSLFFTGIQGRFRRRYARMVFASTSGERDRGAKVNRIPGAGKPERLYAAWHVHAIRT